MTRDVLISIRGMHTDAVEKGDPADEPIEVITPADYFFKNGKHYIIYDEVAEGISGVTKNKIKITGDDSLEIIKSGVTQTHMVFERGKKHLTAYATPFGQLMMGIRTTDIRVREEEEKIDVEIQYDLEINDELVAESTITISIESKSAGMKI